MKFNRFTLLFAVILAFFGQLNAQTPKDYVLPLQAAISTNPPAVLLAWLGPVTNDTFLVIRREKDSDTWFNLGLGLSTDTTIIVDNSVEVGKGYEYAIQQQRQANPVATGYAAVSVALPLVENRGKVLLFVDINLETPLAAELTRLENDLIGDGWEPVKFSVTPNSTVATIKNTIKGAYGADPTGVKSALFLGEIPVPYSGITAWDAHPDHVGAWPADAYYADMDGVYTDVTVNNSVAARAANKNIPGDGKFDQDQLLTRAEIQIGRVDFRHLTQATFGATPTELIRRYLDKDHNWRVNNYSVDQKALIDDNFGVLTYPNGFYEAFAESGFRTAIPLVGEENVEETDFFGANDNSYLFAHASGAGSYTSAGGVGTSAQFGTDTVNIVFTNVFGSYHGDWDYETDPFMPAALASKGGILNCSWAGRPMNFWQSLTFGEPVGYAMKEGMNAQFNNGFLISYGESGMHVSLLGDPTIRTHYIAPATNLGLTQNCQTVELNWGASVDTDIAGYHIYRSTAKAGPYTRLTTDLALGETYQDNGVTAGTYYYMVKAVKPTSTPGGGIYWNNSTGVLSEIIVTDVTPPTLAATGGQLDCAHPSVTLISTTDDPSPINYFWEGPNGFTSLSDAPVVEEIGIYELTLIASNGCVLSVETEVTSNFTLPTAMAVATSQLNCEILSVNVFGNSSAPNSTLTWSGPGGFTGSGASITVDQTGPYTLTVTAPNGCTGTSTASVIGSYDPPEVAAMTDIAVLTCNNPTATLSVSSTTANTTYLWWDQTTNVTTTVTTPGNFTVMATGSNGCTAVGLVSVTQDVTQPPVVPLPVQSLTCAAPCIVLPTQFPLVPYDICWSGPAITTPCPANPNVCQPGIYKATLTNPTNGCTSNSFLEILADSDVPNVAATGGTINCSNNSTVLTANSSTQGILYNWTGPGGEQTTEQNPTVVASGIYTVVVTAPSGCTTSQTVEVIGDFALPGATVSVSNTITCTNQDATLTANSPTTGVTYLWDKGATTQTVLASSGNLSVTITGPNGCKSTAVATLTQDIAAPTLQISSITDCNGTTFYSVNSTGGTPPYSNVISPANWPVLPPNTPYSVIVTGGNGCSVQTSGVSPNPVLLTATATSTPSSNLTPTGTATAGATGGTAPYFYKWSNGSTTATISNLPGGTYQCTVTDGAGCVKVVSVVVEVTIATDEPDFVEKIALSPNPTSGAADLFLVLKKAMPMSVEIHTADGRLISQTVENQWLAGNQAIDLSNQPSGVYFIKINLGGEILTRRLTVVK